MPTTQKKTAGSGNKSRSQQAGKTKPRKKSQKVKKQTQSRLVGALIYLLLAMLVLLGLFGVKAVVIDVLCNGLKGLVGYGFWLTAPVFLLAAFLLLFQRKRSVTFRVWCAIFLPVFLGAFLHLFLSSGTYRMSLSGEYALWNAGIALKSGGAVSGLLAVAFWTWFSRIGAAIIFLLVFLLLLFAALNLTPGNILEAVHRYRENRYDDEEYGDAEDDEEDFEADEASTVRRPHVMDIPVDDSTLVPTGKTGSGDQESLAHPRRKGFFNRTSAVKRPDELLKSFEQEDPKTDSTPKPSPEPPTPIPETEPTLPLPAEPECAPKNTREQIQEKAQEVARDIQNGMETTRSEYLFPPITLLEHGVSRVSASAKNELAATQKRLAETLHSFGIDAKIAGAVQGPSVTRYEVELEQGVRLNRLTNLADDVALSLGVSGVRIAPVPGKISMVGIEVPNQQVMPVRIREVLSSDTFRKHASKVSFAVGKDIGGNYIVGNAAKLPHLLIAGTTGSGKSVCTNSLIISFLFKASPEDVRLIMVDPKMVELGVYNGIPHLLIPVVTDPKKAAGALQWAVTEMMKRYRSFSEVGVRDLASYNSRAEKNGETKLPQIVVVIDELADLMLVAAKEVEESICRVAQMGRAAGMHLIIATQRPSADVITGLMKANIPSRIAFAVASSLESRIILDTQGAEKLVGKGDMLWSPLGSGKPLRVQGCLITDEEVASVVQFVKQNATADYDEEIIHQIEQHVEEQEKGGKSTGTSGSGDTGEENYDELFPAAVDIVLDLGQASVSMLQRRLKLGYSRAARLVDQMEERGIVGPFEGSKPRQLLVSKEQWRDIQNRNQDLGHLSEENNLMPPFDLAPEKTDN